MAGPTMAAFMRVGVDFRILAVGREWMNRGLGRYTQQQLAAVLAADTGDEFVIICPPGADLSLVKGEIRFSPAVSILTWDGGEPESVNDTGSLLERGAAYEEWIGAAGIDVYHATTPFHLSEPTIADFSVCPLVATYYDAIPLVFPSQYMDWWPGPQRDTYMRSLALLGRAARLIAISDSARHDAGLYTGFPRSRIDVAYPVAEPCFQPMSPAEVQTATAALRSRMALPPRYVMTVSHTHHAKNLRTFLHGYAHLSAGLRKELPLLVCCHMEQRDIDFVARITAGLGIADDVVLTGLVTDEELAALYNAATLVVHPSRYEGFGLPVLEAMHCGTPVVSTRASSLPEVAGDAAVLVDPGDALGFAEAIQELVADPGRRLELADAGLSRVQRFNHEQLGRATLASYRAAVAEDPALCAPRRPRLAFWTPLQPEQAGIADCSVELLDQLRMRFDVEVFVGGGFLPSPEVLRRFRIWHFDAYERRKAQAPFDAAVYQVGDSPPHSFMYEPVQGQGKIAELHDVLERHAVEHLAVRSVGLLHTTP